MAAGARRTDSAPGRVVVNIAARRRHLHVGSEFRAGFFDVRALWLFAGVAAPAGWSWARSPSARSPR